MFIRFLKRISLFFFSLRKVIRSVRGWPKQRSNGLKLIKYMELLVISIETQKKKSIETFFLRAKKNSQKMLQVGWMQSRRNNMILALMRDNCWEILKTLDYFHKIIVFKSNNKSSNLNQQSVCFKFVTYATNYFELPALVYII